MVLLVPLEHLIKLSFLKHYRLFHCAHSQVQAHEIWWLQNPKDAWESKLRKTPANLDLRGTIAKCSLVPGEGVLITPAEFNLNSRKCLRFRDPQLCVGCNDAFQGCFEFRRTTEHRHWLPRLFLTSCQWPIDDGKGQNGLQEWDLELDQSSQLEIMASS